MHFDQQPPGAVRRADPLWPATAWRAAACAAAANPRAVGLPSCTQASRAGIMPECAPDAAAAAGRAAGPPRAGWRRMAAAAPPPRPPTQARRPRRPRASTPPPPGLSIPCSVAAEPGGARQGLWAGRAGVQGRRVAGAPPARGGTRTAAFHVFHRQHAERAERVLRDWPPQRNAVRVSSTVRVLAGPPRPRGPAAATRQVPWRLGSSRTLQPGFSSWA